MLILFGLPHLYSLSFSLSLSLSVDSVMCSFCVRLSFICSQFNNSQVKLTFNVLCVVGENSLLKWICYLSQSSCLKNVYYKHRHQPFALDAHDRRSVEGGRARWQFYTPMYMLFVHSSIKPLHYYDNKLVQHPSGYKLRQNRCLPVKVISTGIGATDSLYKVMLTLHIHRLIVYKRTNLSQNLHVRRTVCVVEKFTTENHWVKLTG